MDKAGIKPKIVFMGTADFGVPILKRLADECEILLVVTSPDKPVGRKQILTPSSVKVRAQELDLAIAQPEKLRGNEEFLQRLRDLDPEVIVVVAYGKILPAEILTLPTKGCLNIHGSLLPKYRGVSPMQTALLNGDKETGITIIKMDEGMDTGEIVSKKVVAIDCNDDLVSLSQKLTVAGADLISETLPCYLRGELALEPQDNISATYCGKIIQEMGYLDWSKTAWELHNQIRGLSQNISCFTTFQDKKLFVLQSRLGDDFGVAEILAPGIVVRSATNKALFGVQCADVILTLVQVQLVGKNPVAPQDIANGYQDFVGSILK